MGKKHCRVKNNGDSNAPAPSSSGDIFTSLFGDVQEQGKSYSIFSEDNPFRRKPNDQLGFASVENKEGNFQNPDSGEGRKRKKVSDVELISAGKGPETPLEIKKSKKESNFGVESEDFESKKGNLGENDIKDPNLGANLDMELNGLVLGKKKRNKRKRNELEADYEAKRYGEVVVNDESGERGAVVGEKRKTMDSVEDMVVEKESFDDEDKLLRTVFVGNLPLKVKKKALLREFRKFGEVDSVRIRSVPIINSKTPRKGAIMKKQINDSVDSVHAYIVFTTEESAQASLSHNMAVVEGNHIRVDRACPPRKKLKGEDGLLYDSKRTVFVGNLPFDVKDEEIYQLFSSINNLESSIEAVRVIRDPGTSVGKGIAYVLFKTRDAANVVVRKRNLKIRDRDLRLSHSKSNSTPAKRKNSSPAEQKYSPAKKFVAGSRTTPDSKAKTMAYQGLRASKSGIQKKVHTKRAEPVKFKPRTQKDQKPKERTEKRPAVAARKANALKKAGGGVSVTKRAGKKRKMEGQTPESSRQNKKTRKFR